MPTPLPQRVPENAPGDFYVQAGRCLSCCLPHEEAPQLLNDPKQFFKECYFRRQPQTSEEIDRAIGAICASDIDAYRYGGTDPLVIAKLRARGAAAQCDHTPEGQASLETLANPPIAPPAPQTIVRRPPLTYFRPPSAGPASRLVRGMKRARTILGWIAASTGVFACFSSGDRNPLQWPSIFVFMASALLFFWAVLVNWLLDSYVAWTSRRRPRA